MLPRPFKTLLMALGLLTLLAGFAQLLRRLPGLIRSRGAELPEEAIVADSEGAREYLNTPAL